MKTLNFAAKFLLGSTLALATIVIINSLFLAKGLAEFSICCLVMLGVSMILFFITVGIKTFIADPKTNKY